MKINHILIFNILNAATALSCRQWNPGFNLRSQESTKKRWGFLKHSSAQPPHCLAAWMLHQCVGDLWGLVYVGFSCLSKCRSIQTTCHLPRVRTQTSNSVWARHSEKKWSIVLCWLAVHSSAQLPWFAAKKLSRKRRRRGPGRLCFRRPAKSRRRAARRREGLTAKWMR